MSSFDVEEIEETPAWLNAFLEQVAHSYEMANPSEQAIGTRWFHEDGVYEVVVFPSPVEVNGEQCLPSDICIDILRVIGLFAPCDDVTMMFGSDHDHVSVEGKVDVHDVWLHLLNDPPEDAPATSRVHADGSFEDIDTRGEDPS
jgi:hypothetical protein